MNTEIALCLLYPCVHLLLATESTLAPESGRNPNTGSVHPYNKSTRFSSAARRLLLSAEQ